MAADHSERRRANAGQAAQSLPIPARLQGEVVDPNGRPIEGALVCADQDPTTTTFARPVNFPVAATPALPARCIESDQEGKFLLDGLRGGGIVLHAAARGFLPLRYHDQPGTQPLHLQPGENRDAVRMVLCPGGVPLRGVVEDLYGGPISGAVVSLVQAQGLVAGSFTRDLSGALSWTSNDQGQVDVWVPVGVVALHAEAHGYARSVFVVIAPGPEVELHLGPEAVLAGIVRDGETGDGVPDAAVFAASLPAGLTRSVTTTDSTGRFRIEGPSLPYPIRIGIARGLRRPRRSHDRIDRADCSVCARAGSVGGPPGTRSPRPEDHHLPS